MKRIKINLFWILTFYCLTLIITNHLSAKSTIIAKVQLLKGSAVYKLKSKKSFSKLKQSQKLNSDTVIKTSKKSTVTLKLLNGSLVEMKPNSQIVLNKELLKRSSVSLIRGGAKFKINKLMKAEKFNVYTPTAVAGVRGTEYDIGIANDGSMAVNVTEGAVAVGNGQSEAAVTKNQSTSVSPQDKTVKSTKGQINIDDRNKKIDQNIEKDPSQAMKAINGNMKSTAVDQKKTVDGLSKVTDPNDKKAGELVDSALFNQCKTEGLYGAASKISDENKGNKDVQNSFKMTAATYDRLSKLNKLLEEKFARLDKIYEEKGKALDKKFDSVDDKFKGKFKDFNFDK